MSKCECYEQYVEHRTCYTKHGRTYDEPVLCGRCTGTKEVDRCHCGGDESKCDFYDYVRERAKKKNVVKNARKQLKAKDVASFVLGGNATVTVQSGKTGAHFTYKIKRHKDEDLYFVRLLVDDNNTYRYVGCYYADRKVLHFAKPWKEMVIESCPPSIRALKFLFEKLENPPEQLLVYHEGRCARCGRPLTTPESIERGFGPECYKLEVNN